jgi:hypothetical protein
MRIYQSEGEMESKGGEIIENKGGRELLRIYLEKIELEEPMEPWLSDEEKAAIELEEELADIGLTDSQAYYELRRGSSIRILKWFYSHRKEATGDGKITLAFERVLDETWISTSRTFKKALIELYSKGFIDVVFDSPWKNCLPTEFKLSERWRDYGSDKPKVTESPRDSVVTMNLAVNLTYSQNMLKSMELSRID